MQVAEACAVVPLNPEEPWDHLEVVAGVLDEQASTTLADSKCTLIRKPVVDSGAAGLEENE